MRRKRWISAAAVAAVVGTVAMTVAMAAGAPSARFAQADECQDDPFGLGEQQYVLVIHGDLHQESTDSEGRIAVGGDATLVSFGVGSRLPVDADRIDLAVGGVLNATNVGVNNGSITYGDALNGNATAPNGTITQRPLDLDAYFQEAQRRSEFWGGFDTTGDISGPGDDGALYMIGTDPDRNVFDLDAADLEQAGAIRINVPFGSSTLINVHGTSYDTSTRPTYSLEFWDGTGYVQFGDQAPSDELEALRRALVWNFPEATAIQIGPQLGWHGTVLAPGAAFSFPGNTQLNGTIIAGSLAGNGESHLHLPDGCLPPVPPGPDPTPTPTPSPTPAPSPTPTPTPPPPTPTPTPTPVPPGPTPEPPPPPTPPVPPPFVPTPPDGGGVLPDTDASTDIRVLKQVLTRTGKRVELVKRRPGQLVRFRLRGYNQGFATARAVRACDIVPRGLALVRAPGDPVIRKRRICWNLGAVDTKRAATITFRVRARVCGRAVNRIVVRSRNGGRDRDRADVSACRRVLPRTVG